MKGILFLSWFLAYFLPVVLALKNPTPTTYWYNSSPDDAHQKESLANGWFKYLSGHWGRKFHYGCLFTSPPAEPTLVRPYASFYLLVYLVDYYLLGCFSSMFGRFAYLGHLGHLAMVTLSIGLVIAGLNVGALAHQLESLFPAKWVPDMIPPRHYTVPQEPPLNLTRETEYIGHEGKWYKRPPRFFKDKYNYLPAYFVPMTLPLTPQPDRPMETPTAAETTFTQLFGVLYITLIGMMDSMIPTSGPWSLLGQSMSYIIKLAPILWWALPTGSAQPHPELPNASTYAWFPDNDPHANSFAGKG
ncbi:hypothetical protein DSO57_1004631 [Entomophthora muscae]|uniref:Uncharacterized protein n=1 Tax=Entomophthora muscae TaxID=34485 RepID=A0ACC2SL50_9FUNG|nr:hypothetical protein DSO57_1004631 [Entomophthora muscae]